MARKHGVSGQDRVEVAEVDTHPTNGGDVGGNGQDVPLDTPHQAAVRKRRKVDYHFNVQLDDGRYTPPLSVSGFANAKTVGQWIKDMLVLIGHTDSRVSAVRKQSFEF